MTLICHICRNNKPLPKYFTDRKFKMSAVFIFQLEGAKKDNIFNFLKGNFSVMRGLMDMIFGVFSETYVRLLTSITSQFFSSYGMVFVIFKILLNLVSMQNLLNANNCWHKQNLENFPRWSHTCFQSTFRISYWFYLIFGSLGCKKCC